MSFRNRPKFDRIQFDRDFADMGRWNNFMFKFVSIFIGITFVLTFLGIALQFYLGYLVATDPQGTATFLGGLVKSFLNGLNG